jgi:hypothetical protein
MSVAALSTAGFSQYISASSNVSASQQALQALGQSLASGNLAAAQTAFNTYNQLNQGSKAASSSSSSESRFAKDMAALGTAIGSGNLSTAQSAFATLQGDLKSTPSQAMSNAEGAVAQTVQWVDDLLSLSSTSHSPTTPVDPATAILDSAFGVNTSTSSTDPTTALLENAYGTGSSGSTGSTGATSTSTAPLSGNAGNSASVNVYA